MSAEMHRFVVDAIVESCTHCEVAGRCSPCQLQAVFSKFLSSRMFFRVFGSLDDCQGPILCWWDVKPYSINQSMCGISLNKCM